MKPELRSTRRGWMTFLAAPDDNGSAADPAGAAAEKTEAEKTDTTQPIDYKAKLLALLGLDETADDAAIEAKAAEVQGTLAKVPELETTAAGAGDATTKLKEANDELERVRGEYQTLYDRDQAAQKQKAEAEVDAILEQYADRFTDEKAKARIRAILVSDRVAGMEILEGLSKAAAPSEQTAEEKKAAAPPKPKHDPGAEADTVSEEEIAQKTRARVTELQKKFPKKNSAELWAQAEKEIRAELAA